MIRRFRHALPSMPEFLAGSIAWGALMGANAAAALFLGGWRGAALGDVALLFLLGGALAFPLSTALARLLSFGRPPHAVFAAILFCLAVGTVATTGLLFALQYRHYYAQWHAPLFTEIWLVQFVFTVLAALYQFAVLGVRLFFPLGFAALLAAALMLTRVEMRRRP